MRGNWKRGWCVLLVLLNLLAYPVSVKADSCNQLIFASQTGSSITDSPMHIFAMSPDGSNKRPITEGDTYDTYPIGSPDGERIAFLRNTYLQQGDFEFHLHVMNPDGSGIKQLTHGTTLESYPVWSPDGKQIAYISRQDDGQQRGTGTIFIVDADGGQPASIIDVQVGELRFGDYLHDIYGQHPLTFALDGQHLYYQSFGMLSQIDLKTKRMTTIATHGEDFELSTDGKRFVYVDGKGGMPDIFTMDADGSNIEQLTTSGEEAYPTWSPDGSLIAFTSNRNGTSDFLSADVYVMEPDGSNLKRLTHDMGAYWNPLWSPDGNYLVFWSVVTNQTYIVGSDRKGLRVITKYDEQSGWAQRFSWLPTC